MRCIVVGVDGSPSSRAALRWAARRAAEMSAELRVVTAVAEPPPITAAVGGAGPIIDTAHVVRSTAAWQRDLVLEAVSVLPIEPPVRMVLATGRPLRVLREQSRWADLLVLGAGRGRRPPLLRRCQRRIDCPVVAIDGEQPR